MITDPVRDVIIKSTYADFTNRFTGPFWSEHIVDVEGPAFPSGPVERTGRFCSVRLLTMRVPSAVETHGTQDIDNLANQGRAVDRTSRSD
jgi:hypothetical protein